MRVAASCLRPLGPAPLLPTWDATCAMQQQEVALACGAGAGRAVCVLGGCAGEWIDNWVHVMEDHWHTMR